MMNRFKDDGAPRIFMQNDSPVHTAAIDAAILTSEVWIDALATKKFRSKSH